MHEAVIIATTAVSTTAPMVRPQMVDGVLKDYGWFNNIQHFGAALLLVELGTWNTPCLVPPSIVAVRRSSSGICAVRLRVFDMVCILS